MKSLNGVTEVLRSFERCLITSEKFSVYFSEVYNPTPPHPLPHPMLGVAWGGVGGWRCNFWEVDRELVRSY
jgi:hypothetical protein